MSYLDNMSLGRLLKRARELGVISPDPAEVEAARKAEELRVEQETIAKQRDFHRTWVAPTTIGVVCSILAGIVGAVITALIQ